MELSESDKLLDIGAEAYRNKDYQKAQEYYEKSAKLGNAQAECNLGYIYAFGRNGVKDDKQAFSWFKKSAEKGNANACYKIGDSYLLGKGIERDPDMALIFYRKAADIAEQTEQDADIRSDIYYRIALCAHKGYGMEPNDFVALECINEAEFYSYHDRFAGKFMWKKLADKIEKLRTEILTTLDNKLDQEEY